jgi:hypothetical protein
VTSLYAPNSVHASFSHSVSWLPGFMLRKLQLRGVKEKRHETILSVAKACAKHIQKSVTKAGDGTAILNNAAADDDYLPLRPFPITTSEQKVPAEPTQEEPVDTY